MTDFVQETTMANLSNPTYFIPNLDYLSENHSDNLKIKKYKKRYGEISDTQVDAESGDPNVKEYTILQYKKEKLSSSEDKLGPTLTSQDSDGASCRLGSFRSLIFNDTKELIGFSPTKSLSYNSFVSKYEYQSENIIPEEFIEGTMINCFYNKEVENWEIATKSFVGANNHFFKFDGAPMTFSQMFNECWVNCGFPRGTEEALEYLDKDFCYSFVMQHPDNRLVTKFTIRRLVLVNMFKITKNGTLGWNVYESDKSSMYNYVTVLNQKLVSPVSLPMMFTKDLGGAPIYFNGYSGNIIYSPTDNYNTLFEWFTKMAPPQVQGVVIKNTLTGERTKIRNPQFEYVRNLRGNQPKLEYHYLELRKNGRLQEFLQWYPEYNEKMYIYQQKIHDFTLQLYNNYVSCYMKKEAPLNRFPQEYKTHMFNIHRDIYNARLKQNKTSVQKTHVIQYVNDLPERLLMFCLNLKFRKTETVEETSEQQLTGSVSM